MEAEIFDKIAESIRNNRSAALITLIEIDGSTPGESGSVMAVWADGATEGTIGGGNLEYAVIQEALKCIETAKSKEFVYDLSSDGDIGMNCGGNVRLFIKIFAPKERLIIVGAGHIGQQLYNLGLMFGFSVVVIDDREEYASKNRFPNAENIICGDVAEALKSLDINESCYIAIATRSHETDENALKAAADKCSAYTGMIGSSKKIKTIMTNLLNAGVKRDFLEKVYAPMGLNIANVKPAEIAFSTMSEILLVKNNGSAEHMKSLKNIQY